MKARILGPALGFCAAIVLFGGVAFAREGGGKPREKPKPGVTGLVTTTKEKKDDKEVITAVTITQTRKTGDIVHNVVLDDVGKELGEKMNGKKVRATGIIAEKDGKKEITVEKYEEFVPKPKGEKKEGAK